MTDRPIGPLVQGFVTPPAPGPDRIAGIHVTLERLDPARHADDLFHANQGQDWVWDYMPYGPFATLQDYRDWQAQAAAKSDPFFYALRDNRSGAVGGVASYLRIDPANGVIEIGHIEIAPTLQRSPAATEAISLMIRWAFEAGYRRVEWKCNALNAPSMAAARRYGFTYEGTFRQHMLVRGRNRDSAWFAIMDHEWARLGPAHAAWLAPSNFAPDGNQRQRLSDLTSRARQEE
ncbi:GNAT family N-acetyltransferase [Paracoccus laeviglucosivorans]|uniref:Protein N-acetyltransferase, RimJ/RimL family n=1 Tax=Paracoccus laeviglucosivorans TaxID=1197861 RepID=A0A521ABX6_9RHOB|nr:GNAT family protein [Paracoccus laeviglucosivorans]SMO32324.1 Protein N-acetyltransferase, RimJ/RimL family [Paracoccus laeviglucosivorans]